jgi:anti-sigma regulatory factor (Ser/Thr protein kinase)
LRAVRRLFLGILLIAWASAALLLADLGRRARGPGKVSRIAIVLVTNVILYAFPDVQEHSIDVRLRLEAGVLHADVIDAGRPFDPLSVPPPNLDAPIEERRIGGLGLHVVREMMDTIAYAREGGRNILRLSKRVS